MMYLFNLVILNLSILKTSQRAVKNPAAQATPQINHISLQVSVVLTTPWALIPMGSHVS